MGAIYLLGKHGKGKKTKVDKEDYEELSRFRWFVDDKGYAVRFKGSETIRMHRQLMEPPEGMVVDHISREKLDNRKINLRVCTKGENNRNNTGRFRPGYSHKGVMHVKGTNIWRAYVSQEGIPVHIGTYVDEDTAARAYDYYALKYYKEFASLNFPDEAPQKPIREAAFRTTSSGYRGVGWMKRCNKWFARIRHEKKDYHLGVFECKHDAARMYNFWANDLLGDKARLNTIRGSYNE